MNKVLKGILSVLITIVIIVALFLTGLTLATKKYSYPNLFGYVILSVEDDEMVPEFKKGDLIITKVAKDKEYGAGDVVTYLEETEDTVNIKTHRIDSIVTINSEKLYVTKGDNNTAVDEYQVKTSSVVAYYDGTKISYLGSVLSFLRSKIGFFICIIIPLLIFFAYQLYTFIILIIEYNSDEELEEEEEPKKVKKNKSKKTNKKKTKEE